MTLASFDDAISLRHDNRILNTNSQERLIGGKKPTLTISHQPAHQVIQQIVMPAQILNHKPQLQHTYSHPYHLDGRGALFQAITPTNLYQQHPHHQIIHDSHSLEKQKRSCMKTQATQTDKLDEKATHALMSNACGVMKVSILSTPYQNFMINSSSQFSIL